MSKVIPQNMDVKKKKNTQKRNFTRINNFKTKINYCSDI